MKRRIIAVNPNRSLVGSLFIGCDEIEGCSRMLSVGALLGYHLPTEVLLGDDSTLILSSDRGERNSDGTTNNPTDLHD